MSPAWYPGKAVRDLDTGEVVYEWDRSAETLRTIEKYGAVYRRNTDQKAVYLTFDCGFFWSHFFCRMPSPQKRMSRRN